MEYIAVLIIIVAAIYVVTRTFRIVPHRHAFIVERFGKYHTTMEAGLHILVPILDKVSYKHTLKEQAVDVPPQQCITKDNITVEVDGILYLTVMDPKNASYGINDYLFASSQLAQTTMRSIIGRMDLDKTFEERDAINNAILDAVDKASDPWGVKVTRYEVKNIIPPKSIKDAMEKQMRAEREKRALIAQSEGERQAMINRAAGDRQEMIERSEGEKQKRINEAEGRAQEILRTAAATAKGIRMVADSLQTKGAMEALNLRIADQYIQEFGKLAKTNNSMIIPANVSDVAGMVRTIAGVLENSRKPERAEPLDVE
ncbi:MAG: SPFH domain-containing protein [Desulfatibacillaceae bacterium]